MRPTEKLKEKLRSKLKIQEAISRSAQSAVGLDEPVAIPPKPIKIGRVGGEKGPLLELTPDERMMHMQVLGPTGGGKSKFLEHMLKEDFRAGNGFTLIDPTGKLYNDFISWIEYERLWDTREIILLDPNILSHSFGFNPLLFHATPDNPAFGTASMLKAIEQIFRPKGGGGEMVETPRLSKNLGALIQMLSDNDLTLYESLEIIDQKLERSLIDYTLANTDSNTQKILSQLFEMSKQQFEVQTESSINRLQPFLTSPNIRRIFGQQNKTLDFHHYMDDGCVVLCDLSTGGGRTTQNGAQLLGTLLVNEMFVHAQSRTTDSPNAHLLYIDECHRFLNDDVRLVLKESRKFGLSAVLAHQNLADLHEAGSSIYHAVMTNARNKVVFGGLDYQECEVIAQELFDKEIIRLRDTPIEALIKPTQVGVELIELSSSSHTTGEVETESWAETAITGSATFASLATPEVGVFDVGGGTPVSVEGGGDNSGTASTTGGSKSKVDMHTSGKSEAYKPVYKDLPTAVRGEEAIKKQITSALKSLPMRHAAIKSPYNEIATQYLYVPFVKDRALTEEYILKVRERQCVKLPKLYTPNEEIDQENQMRLLELKKKACVPLDLTDDKKEPVPRGSKKTESWLDAFKEDNPKDS